jgi:hypothetical protein
MSEYTTYQMKIAVYVQGDPTFTPIKTENLSLAHHNKFQFVMQMPAAVLHYARKPQP